MDNQQESYLSEECYKTIKEFPAYEINCVGNIRNIKTKAIKYAGQDKSGYIVCHFKSGGHRFIRKIHRLVAEYFLDPPSQALVAYCESAGYPHKPVVKHIDNNKTNNDYKNLEWDSQTQNMKDAFEDGIIPNIVGSRVGTAKLSECVVHKICKDFEDGMSCKGAKLKYNISKQQAEKIHAGYAWLSISRFYNIPLVQDKIFNGQNKGS